MSREALTVALCAIAGGVLLALLMLAIANGLGADPPWSISL